METTPAILQKFDDLLQLEKIEHHHLNNLAPDAKDEFLQYIHSQIPNLHGEELDRYIEQTSSLLDKNEIWEFNHSKIAAIIERHVTEYGTMPNISNIASATKLSRSTVRKHLEAINNPVLTDSANAAGIMLPRVVGSVLKQALTGDLKAAKIYIDSTLKQKQALPAAVITHNNYIQINNITLSQQQVEQLTPQQLKQIEMIITGNNQTSVIP